MAERIRIDHGNFESGRKKIEQWKIPEKVKGELYRFLDDLSLGKVNRGKRISPARQLKYLHALRTPLEFFHKPTAKLQLRDIEDFERTLSSGELGNRFTGKPLAHSTQVDMRLLLRIFLRWRLGAQKADRLTGWLDTRVRQKTPDFLTEAEVEQLYKHCRTAAQRFLIALLFDSGARAEEFHNVRFEDVYMPENNQNFVRIALKQEYSKTLGRTVPLYWKFSLEAVKEYLLERIAKGIKPAEPVFSGNYAATKKFLQRLGMRVLKRGVYYHLFRHSSTTFYATKLNRQELCYRYGWRFSSNMPDIYISRVGMETKALDERFAQSELSTLKADLTKLEQGMRMKDETIRQMGEALRTLQADWDGVSRVLSLKPNLGEVLTAIQRQRFTLSTREKTRGRSNANY